MYIFFLSLSKDINPPQIKLKLVGDKINLNENNNICSAEVCVTAHCNVDPIFY